MYLLSLVDELHESVKAGELDKPCLNEKHWRSAVSVSIYRQIQSSQSRSRAVLELIFDVALCGNQQNGQGYIIITHQNPNVPSKARPNQQLARVVAKV